MTGLRRPSVRVTVTYAVQHCPGKRSYQIHLVVRLDEVVFVYVVFGVVGWKNSTQDCDGMVAHHWMSSL